REVLIDRLEVYKADVHLCEESELAATILGILDERSCRTVPYAPGMAAQLFADFSGGAAADDESVGPRELDVLDAVVTELTLSCAQTGTIVWESGATDGRRALTLVPDRDICIVRSEDIVYGVPEMVSRINPERPATLVSGPSATSDI